MPNRKIRFGIDIDGTVTCPTALVPYLQRSFGDEIKYEDITEYNLGHVLNKSDEEMTQWFIENQEEIYENSPVHLNADKVLAEWSRDFHLIFISARFDYLFQLTETWFKMNHIPYHHIELTGSHDKIEAARKLNVDVFIEDKLDNAFEIHEQLNIPVYLFDTPYNQAKLPAGIRRVYSWDDLNNDIRLKFK